MSTYSIARPAATHTRPATCAEVECAGYVHGWTSLIDTTTDLGLRQANYIDDASGRRFHANRLPGGVIEYVFAPGQECFNAHTVPVERDPLYVVRQGAHGRYLAHRVHDKPEHWVEDFAGNQDRLAKLID